MNKQKSNKQKMNKYKKKNNICTMGLWQETQSTHAWKYGCPSAKNKLILGNRYTPKSGGLQFYKKKNLPTTK